MTERRYTVRYSLSWPVLLEDGTGTTRDISPSGVCFKTDRELKRGTFIRFALILPEAEDTARYLDCQGKVMRVERRGKGFGIAVWLMQILSVHRGMCWAWLNLANPSITEQHFDNE